MQPQFPFFTSIAFSFIAWGIVTARYIWPQLRHRQRADALRPLLMLHSFRFIGLSFLVPGVVSSDLSSAFAHSAAYGDIIAATLALFSLLWLGRRWGVLIAWLFNLWGSADLLNAFYQANAAGLSPGQLGAAYFIPTFLVPLLLITHGLMFRILLQRRSEFHEPRRLVGGRDEPSSAMGGGLKRGALMRTSGRTDPEAPVSDRRAGGSGT